MATHAQADEILKGLVVIVDTRKQHPFRFPGMSIIFEALPTGDYSIKGFTDKVAVERKEYGDFLQCVSHQRARFMREVERLVSFPFKLIVIETEYGAIAAGQHPHSRVHPSSAIGTIVRLTAQGIPVVTAGGHKLAEDFTLRFLKRSYLTLRGIK